MDRYAARLLLTAVLFGAVAVSATLFSDALTQAAGSEPQPVSVRRETDYEQTTEQKDIGQAYYLSVRTQPQAQTNYVTVMAEDGTAAGSWQTAEDGDTTVGPLYPGTYYARARETGYVRFVLEENAAVTAQAGCGWADGELLYLTDYEPSRLELRCLRQTEGLVTLTLERGGETVAEQTGQLPKGRGSLIFDGLRPGSYDICLNGETLRTVSLNGYTSLWLPLPPH